MELGNRSYNNQIRLGETLTSGIQLREAMQEAKMQEKKDDTSRNWEARSVNQETGARRQEAGGIRQKHTVDADGKI